jgi:hypothetical protein
LDVFSHRCFIWNPFVRLAIHVILVFTNWHKVWTQIPNYSFQTRPGSRSKFRILIGSPGCPSQLFFKSKRRCFSKKNKSQRVAIRFLTGSCQVTGSTGSHRVFSFPIFSSTRPGFSPGSTRQAEPGFKTIFLRELYKFG